MRKCLLLVLATLLLAIVQLSHAQQARKILRIGFLDSSTAAGSAVPDTFRQEMRKLGWIEGKNFIIEYRFGEQKPERLPELAADLVRLKVDLIVISGITAALAAKKATTTIPIVMTSVVDPVGAGVVASLARPGGNVTGFSGLGAELNTKRLEILKDAVPKLARVGLLRLPTGTLLIDLQMKELRPAAFALKLQLEEIETQSDAKGLESAFQDLVHITSRAPIDVSGVRPIEHEAALIDKLLLEVNSRQPVFAGKLDDPLSFGEKRASRGRHNRVDLLLLCGLKGAL